MQIKYGGSCNYGESLDFEDREKHVEVFAQGAFLDRSAGTPGYSAALVCDSVGREGRSDPSASAAGSVTRNRAPRPSLSLCAAIVLAMQFDQVVRSCTSMRPPAG